MKLTDIHCRRGIRPVKHPLREVPHLVIEPNYTCNLNCRACYNLNKDHVKTLEEIRSEIDTGLSKRNLETISILGGEPTLHPDLTEIVRYIKSKGLICQLLTNGVLLHNDQDEALLKSLVGSGVDRIILHTDTGQDLDQEMRDRIAETLFTRFEKYRIFFSISVTIYPENACTLPDIIKKYSHFRFFDGILALLEQDARDILKKVNGHNIVQLYPEYLQLRKELQLEPVTYIPSSLDDQEISWLMYFYYINPETEKTLRMSPVINRIFRRIYRIFKGKQVFGIVPDPRFFKFNFLISVFAEFLVSPFHLSNIIALIRHSDHLAGLRFHYILIQSGPVYHKEKERVRLCYHCFDATIRNGKLTPVCLADLINPVTETEQPAIPEELRRTVYQHLGEL